MKDETLTIPYYRVEGMLRHQQELEQIMNPESVQVANAIIGYLQSAEFFVLVGLLLAYRFAKNRR